MKKKFLYNALIILALTACTEQDIIEQPSTPNGGYGAQQHYYPNILKYDPDQLKIELSSKNGASLIGTKTGDTVEERFSSIEQEVKESTGKSLSNIKIFAELPLRPAGY